MNKEIFINEERPHESGTKHETGQAHYTDDIPEVPNTLYGAIGWSRRAHAIIKKIKVAFPVVKKLPELLIGKISAMKIKIKGVIKWFCFKNSLYVISHIILCYSSMD